MHIRFQLAYSIKLVLGVIACALLLSACGGSSGGDTTVSGVETPSKVSIANTK